MDGLEKRYRKFSKGDGKVGGGAAYTGGLRGAKRPPDAQPVFVSIIGRSLRFELPMLCNAVCHLCSHGRCTRVWLVGFSIDRSERRSSDLLESSRTGLKHTDRR